MTSLFPKKWKTTLDLRAYDSILYTSDDVRILKIITDAHSRRKTIELEVTEIGYIIILLQEPEAGVERIATYIFVSESTVHIREFEPVLDYLPNMIKYFNELVESWREEKRKEIR